MYSVHCESLWMKAFARCINVKCKCRGNIFSYAREYPMENGSTCRFLSQWHCDIDFAQSYRRQAIQPTHATNMNREDRVKSRLDIWSRTMRIWATNPKKFNMIDSQILLKRTPLDGTVISLNTDTHSRNKVMNFEWAVFSVLNSRNEC